jgi:predicted DsbA family dithiol-disulfide isomerase
MKTIMPPSDIPKKALDFLQSNELEKEVNDMCAAARSKGITGVPITVIDGRWAITGSQSSDVYIQVSQHTCAKVWPLN